MEIHLDVGAGAEDGLKNINCCVPDEEINGFDSDDKDCKSEDGESAGFDLEKAHKHLADLVCSCEVTISSMLDFQKQLNPSLKLSYDTVKAKCLKIYEEEKVEVKNFFADMKGQISLSVDVLNYYRCSGCHDEYMCLSAHFIDDSWKPRKWVLRFQHLSDWEDDMISEAILKTLKDLQIEDKVSTFTYSFLDEDEFDDDHVGVVKSQIQTTKKLQLDGQLFRLNCCASMFNQMANDAFEEISDIIDKASQLNSWKSPPLWHLTTHKLKMALEMEAMGEYFPDKISGFYDVPSSDEWKQVEVVCKLTERVQSIAKVLFETKDPTPNIYLTYLQELRLHLILESKSSCNLTSNVAKDMLMRLDKYLKKFFVLLGVASFLDPRYKMKYIEYLSSKSEGNVGKSEVAIILDAVCNLYDGCVTNDPEDLMDASDFSDSEEEDEEEEDEEDEKAELMGNEEQGFSAPPARKKAKKPAEEKPSDPSWVQEYKQFTESDVRPPKSDLEWYLEEPVITWSQNFSALKWWKAKGPKYPTLAKMARDILAIPMSVATSDGAYCTEPREAKVDCLGRGKDLQNALMCTRNWLFKKKDGNSETYHVPALCGSFFF